MLSQRDEQRDHAPHLANTLLALAHLKRCQGDLVQAVLLAEESSKHIEEWGDPKLVSLQFLVRGEIARANGDLLQALTLFEQGLSLLHSYQPIIGWFLIGLASVAQAQGKPVRAARLLGLAERLRKQTAALDQQRQRECEDIVRSVREQLGEEAFITAKAQGALWSLQHLNDL